MTDVRLTDVARLYGDKPAVLDLSLHVRNGEFVSLLGPSGCGKTTTLALIAGLDRPTRGTIAIGGEIVANGTEGHMVLPEHRNLGLVPQSYALWPHMTVARNVGYPLKLRRVPRRERERRVEEALALVEMAALAGRYPHELSGGQQQRVAVARTLVYRPKVLLMDEPLSNLDAKLRERTRQWLRGLQRELGITTIFVTHDQLEALSLSDRVAVLDSGRLVQYGTPEEVYARPATPFVADFVGGCSFLEGRVAADPADRLRVVVDGLTEIVLPRPAREFQAGEGVSLVLRPEWLTALPGDAPAGPNTLRAAVTACEFAGGRYLHRAAVGGQNVRFDAPYAVSGEIALACDVARIIPFHTAAR